MAERAITYPAHVDATESRAGIVAIFGLGGGPIGGLLLYLIFIAAIVVQGLAVSGPPLAQAVVQLLPAMLMFIVFGFGLGIVPAVATGFFYSLLPFGLQRIVVAPVLGMAFASGCALAVGGIENPGASLAYAATGAAAALVCAMIVRKLGLDIRGARASV